MRFNGTVRTWNDERGFGFIAPAHGDQEIFFHIKAWRDRGARPQAGQPVTFEVEPGAEGKKRAKAVEPLRSPPRAAIRKRGGSARWGTATLFAIPAFLVVYLAAGLAWRVPGWVAAVYGGASVLAFIVYAWDKSAAAADAWRVSEATLLAVGLVGGWPGAIVAQQVLRHKSSKASFRATFWGSVVVNVAAFLVAFSPFGSRLLHA